MEIALLVNGVIFGLWALAFYWEQWRFVKIKYNDEASFKFKFLKKFKLYYNTKGKIVYDIDFVDEILRIQPYKDKKGDFKIYSHGELLDTKIVFSKRAKKPMMFAFIEGTELLYNLETKIIYEIYLSKELIRIIPYVTEADNICKYIDGNLIEICK